MYVYIYIAALLTFNRSQYTLCKGMQAPRGAWRG